MAQTNPAQANTAQSQPSPSQPNLKQPSSKQAQPMQSQPSPELAQLKANLAKSQSSPKPKTNLTKSSKPTLYSHSGCMLHHSSLAHFLVVHSLQWDLIRHTILPLNS